MQICFFNLSLSLDSRSHTGFGTQSHLPESTAIVWFHPFTEKCMQFFRVYFFNDIAECVCIEYSKTVSRVCLILDKFFKRSYYNK